MSKTKIKQQFGFSWKDLLFSILILAITFGLCFLMQEFFPDSSNYSSLLFFLAIYIISRFTKGYLFGVIASVIGSFIVNYAFTAPYFKLSFSIPGYILTFFIMLVVATLTSVMTTRIMEEEKIKIEAEKERMRGNFLQSVSHDLRTPLTSIIGNSSELTKSEELSENDQQIAKAIHEEAENLLDMVENVLSISKINTNLKLTLHEELVEELFEEAVHKFKLRYPDARIYVQVPNEIIFVNVEAKLIEQVILNLLENAHIHGSSNVPFVLFAESDKKYVYIRVKDFGVGITDEVYKYLNEPLFISDDSKNKYKGIGLSVSSTIIKLHGGSIEAKNNEDAGATFTIKLPGVKNEK